MATTPPRSAPPDRLAASANPGRSGAQQRRQQGSKETDSHHTARESSGTGSEPGNGERQQDGAGQQERPERGFRAASSGQQPEGHCQRGSARHQPEVALRNPMCRVDDSRDQEAPRREARGQNGDGGADHEGTPKEKTEEHPRPPTTWAGQVPASLRGTQTKCQLPCGELRPGRTLRSRNSRRRWDC